MLGTLDQWNDGAAKRALVEFVERTVSDAVPVEERVAVFDNDGTLWCEKPLPIQADSILRRLFEMAEADPDLRARQPWKAAYERDYDREFDYSSGAEQALQKADTDGWTVVSIKNDWTTVFPAI